MRMTSCCSDDRNGDEGDAEKIEEVGREERADYKYRGI